MKPLLPAVVFSAAALLVAGMDDAWAARGRSGGASAGSSRPSGARPHTGHHHRPRFVGSFFIGSTLYPGPFWHPWYPYPAYYPGPYFYGPDFAARSTPPTIYIERFEGTPAADTHDFILCPQSDTAWPEAKECPGGWARVVTGEQTR